MPPWNVLYPVPGGLCAKGEYQTCIFQREFLLSYWDACQKRGGWYVGTYRSFNIGFITNFLICQKGSSFHLVPQNHEETWPWCHLLRSTALYHWKSETLSFLHVLLVLVANMASLIDKICQNTTSIMVLKVPYQYWENKKFNDKEIHLYVISGLIH